MKSMNDMAPADEVNERYRAPADGARASLYAQPCMTEKVVVPASTSSSPA